MMYELKQVECLFTQKQSIKLHPEVIEILFENKRYIKNAFSNIKGLFGIAHMSMTCIDPSNELIVFSATPNIEYNLIHLNLWLDDPCFVPDLSCKNTLLWWDYEIKKIEQIKLGNNRFTLGMSICRPVGDFKLIYSFATQSKEKDLRTYYLDKLFTLIDIGDYFYKSLKELYGSYNHQYTPPQLSQFDSKAPSGNIKPFLRVI